MKKFEIEFDFTVEMKNENYKTKQSVTIFDTDINTAISQLKAGIIRSYEQCKVMYFPDLIEVSLDFFNEHLGTIKYSNFRGREV